MRKYFILFIISFILCGCNSSSKSKLQDLMKENDYIIVDVRTKEEYNESHLVGAINIPYNEIDEDTKLDKDKTIFVYCKSGNRSSIAYDSLTVLGYNAYDLGAFAEIDLPKE